MTRRTIEEVFSKNGVEMNIAIEAGECFAIKEFVKLGLGIGLVHNICISKAERSKFNCTDLKHIFGQWKTNLDLQKIPSVIVRSSNLIRNIHQTIRAYKLKDGVLA